MFLKLEKYEIDIDSTIKIQDIERELLERFPQLKHRTANMKYVYYVLDNKTVRNRETVVAEGQEIML